MTDKNLIARKADMEKKLSIIRRFAKDMGYTVTEEAYTTESYKKGYSKRPAYSIELNEKWDGEGNPYCWAWFTDTYTMM